MLRTNYGVIASYNTSRSSYEGTILRSYTRIAFIQVRADVHTEPFPVFTEVIVTVYYAILPLYRREGASISIETLHFMHYMRSTTRSVVNAFPQGSNKTNFI